MTTAPAHKTVFAPTDLHRAIDQATILKVELQQLQTLVRTGGAIDLERLRAMEQAINRLTVALIACRDQDQ
jgi:hypothetical protein